MEEIAYGRPPPRQPAQVKIATSRFYYNARNLAAAAVLLIAGFTSAQFIGNPFAPKHNSLASTWIYPAPHRKGQAPENQLFSIARANGG